MITRNDEEIYSASKYQRSLESTGFQRWRWGDRTTRPKGKTVVVLDGIYSTSVEPPTQDLPKKMIDRRWSPMHRIRRSSRNAIYEIIVSPFSRLKQMMARPSTLALVQVPSVNCWVELTSSNFRSLSPCCTTGAAA